VLLPKARRVADEPLLLVFAILRSYEVCPAMRHHVGYSEQQSHAAPACLGAGRCHPLLKCCIKC
jgi:hypothetical protein